MSAPRLQSSKGSLLRRAVQIALSLCDTGSSPYILVRKNRQLVVSKPELATLRWQLSAFNFRIKGDDSRTEAYVTLLNVTSLFAVIGHGVDPPIVRPIIRFQMHTSAPSCTVADEKNYIKGILPFIRVSEDIQDFIRGNLASLKNP